jgi:adenylate cyclase
MLFPDAEAALQASLSLVAESAAHQLPEVRVGVATGQVVPRDGDIFGHTVNLAARIASVAAPSQVLVCGGTHDAAADEMSKIDFEALEPMSLKGVADPVSLFSVKTGP